MAIFFAIFFLVYSSANFYVYVRAMQAFQFQSIYAKALFSVLFVVAAFSYILTKSLLSNVNSVVYDVFLWIGSFWFALLGYFLLSLLVIDIFVLINRFFPFFPQFLLQDYAKTKLLSGLIVLLLVFITVTWGYINANNIKLKTIQLSIPKKNSTLTSLNIFYFSDAHFTPVNNGRIAKKIIELSEQIKPDIILIGGDVIDDKSNQLKRIGIDEELRQLKAKYGVYTINGNHEYIVNVNNADNFLNENNVKVLRDSMITIENSVQIIGREDGSIVGFAHGKRKSVAELVSSARKDLPIILLDHQPFRLAETAAQNVDLQLSGHTHHGQMWPFSFVTKMIYEVSWGYKKINNTHFYVSSGVGTWGPPVKIGNDAEVINFKISFTEN
ncbi:MAG: metallophosphoesterase [Ignavibacteriaceae bacterium]